MQVLTDQIRDLFARHNPAQISSFDKLPQAGSDRHYFRIHAEGKTYIATYGPNTKENETFIYFSEQFKKKQLATANIFYVSEDKSFYIQEDFGNICLLDILEEKGFDDHVY
ncbi:MAG: hypothetical protein EOP48_29925, partial [Sphingobacteriales bacterium]